MRARKHLPTTTADPATALLGIELQRETAPGESEPLLAEGTFRWMPVGDELELPPDGLRASGETLTGRALRRCRITG